MGVRGGRRRAAVAAALWLAALLLGGIFLGETASRVAGCLARGWRGETAYELQAVVDLDARLVTGEVRIRLRQEHGEPLRTAWFYLHPNAPPFREKAGGRDVVHVAAVTVNGRSAAFQVSGTHLRVDLPRPLARGARATIAIQFGLLVPEVRDRFGYWDGVMALGNWYPILAARPGGQWALYPYFPFGDPFYSECASYLVELTVGRDVKVAASALPEKAKSNPDGSRTLSYRAGPMRDFAVVLSRNYLERATTVGKTRVGVFFPPGEERVAGYALEIAVKALDHFAQVFGDYPYPSLLAAVVGMGAGGMEYPGIVFLGRELFTLSRMEQLEYVLVHEVAHQWWYAVVGNDQVREAWLDEGLAEYSTLLYYERYYGRHHSDVVASLRAMGLLEAYLGEGGRGIVLRPLAEFASRSEYEALVYGKAALMLGELRQELGDEMFGRVLQAYFRQFRFAEATTQDFLRVCAEVSGKSLDDFFRRWLHGTEWLPERIPATPGGFLPRPSCMVMQHDVC